MPDQRPLESLRNIGSTVAKRLREVGITTRADLSRVGPVHAYLAMKHKRPQATLPRCYYLYSLEGALRDVHWDDLPQGMKKRLVAEVEKHSP